jgi:hypothetical protein
MRIELENCREELEKLYSPNPRGRKSYDPVCMLRAMLLMVILKYSKITEFANFFLNFITSPEIIIIHC